MYDFINIPTLSIFAFNFLGSMLKVSLLGKTVFQYTQGTHEPFRKSLRLSILGYLIRVGQPVSRKRLSRIFWPHLSDADARTYLRNILARLKVDFSPWLEINRDTVFFNGSDSCSIDLYELEQVLARYEQADFNTLTEAQLNEFRDGLLLYEGPFMGDLSRTVSPWFEKWLRSERQTILNQVLNGYSKLIEARIDRQEWSNGIEDARQMIRLNQDYQVSWLWLMRCLANSGDLRRAQEAYERYERTPTADVQQSAVGREMHQLYRKIGQRISGINLDFSNDTDIGLSK